jgi:hypothetical protein
VRCEESGPAVDESAGPSEWIQKIDQVWSSSFACAYLLRLVDTLPASDSALNSARSIAAAMAW